MVNTQSPAQPAPSGKSARFTVAAKLNGFPIQIEVEGNADSLQALIERLKDIGAEPPEPLAAQLKALDAESAQATGRDGTPLCPVHRAPMKPSQKSGTFFCSKKDADGGYCREQA